MSSPDIATFTSDIKNAVKSPEHDYSKVMQDVRDLQSSGKSQDEIKSYYNDLHESLKKEGVLPDLQLENVLSSAGGGNNSAQSSSNSDQKLFGDSDWKGKINAAGVEQGKYGDCYFMSSLASLSNTDQGKQAIHDMITVNDDGTYSVRFPGDKNAPVHVTEDDIKNAGVQSPSKWANVIETAFVNYTNAVGGPQMENIDVLARVQNARQAMDLLTGNSSVQTDQFSATDVGEQQPTIGATSKANVEGDLNDAFQNGRPVVASASHKGLTFALGENNAGPLQDAHVYSVVGWDPQSKTVTVRNPWGAQNADLKPPDGQDSVTVDGITAKSDGTMSMSLDTFYQRFNSMSVSGKDDNVSHIENTVGQGATDFGTAVFGLATGNPQQVISSGKDLIVDHNDLANETAYTASRWGWEKAKDVYADVSQKEQQVLTDPVGTVTDTASNIKDTIVGWVLN